MRHVHHASRFRRDIARPRDRDSHARRRKRGGIVDPIARHRDRTALPLQLPHPVEFLLRQQFRFELRDADLARHRLSRAPPIARQHHHATDLDLTELRHRLANSLTQPVAQQDRAGQAVILRHQNRRRANRVRFFEHRLGVPDSVLR